MITQLRLVLPRASTVAGRIDDLSLFLTLVTIFFTALICVLIVYFALKYRRRSEDEVPRPTVTHTRLELLWTVIPLILVMVMFFWGTTVYTDIKRPPANAAVIHVIGKQWMWKVQHPQGSREINELHVPTGRVIKLVMTSQDVIHDFSIPAFRLKQDVLPGSYVTQWFTATRPGVYQLFCAEYCGTNHSGMIGRVVVMEPAAYEQWLAGSSVDEPPAVAGSRIFAQYGCANCHGQRAPTLAGLYGRNEFLEGGRTIFADEEYLRESILDPAAKLVAGYQPIMPSFRGQLTEEQVMDLIAYIKVLGDARAPVNVPGQPATTGPTTLPAPADRPERIPNQPPVREEGSPSDIGRRSNR